MPDWKDEIERRVAGLELEPAREAEIIEELSQHLEDRYKELVSAGNDEKEARRLAISELSESPLLAKELRQIERPSRRGTVVLGERGSRMFGNLRQDFRYAMRMLRKNPSFTFIAVLMLALGIGANTAIFSAVNALLLRPLPIKDIDRLAHGSALREGFDPFGTSLLEYAAYKDQSKSLESFGVGIQRFFNLIEQGEPERLRGAVVVADYLNTLSVGPTMGRTFTAEEDAEGGPAVALIGYDLWQRRFGGDTNIVGQPLNLEGRSHEIIGVMPRGFNMPFASEIWTPLQVSIQALPLEQRAANAYEMIARLSPGASLEQADAELKGIARQLEQEYPQIRQGWSYKLVPLRRQLIGDLEGRTNNALIALVAAVGFLLLICCANVANLLLARGVAREREISIRLALGAGRWRVIRQLLAESLVLAVAGGISGLLLAYWVAPLLAALNPVRAVSLQSFLIDFQLDGRVLAFSLIVSMLTGLIFGIVPALKATGSGSLMTLLKQREQRSGGQAAGRRWLGALVVVEIAMAMTLLVGGGLMVQSFERLQKVELGFQPDNLLVMEMALSADKYREHHERAAFTTQALDRIRALPGVVSAGATTNIPLQSGSFDSVFTVEGRPQANPSDVPITAHRMVSPGYLETLGVNLIKGRLLNEGDRADTLPVTVISEELARQAWPGEDPLGKLIRRGRAHQTHFPWMTVVGVVSDVKEDRYNFRINRPAWYLPYSQHTNNRPINLLIQTTGDAASLTASVRDAVREIDPDQPLSSAMVMNDHLSNVVVTERFSAVLMGALAALGLLLAALGLYGVMAYSVTQRTGELGLRQALGARPSDIFKLVIAEGMTLIVIGLGAGLAAALALTRFLSGALYEVSPTDPATFAVIALILAVVALAACYIPARRATRVDPIVALRYE